jgi:hypothetical protein
MWLEGQHHGCQLAVFCHLGQPSDQRGMPQVNPIEISDGEHDGGYNGTRITAKDAHGQTGEKNVEL